MVEVRDMVRYGIELGFTALFTTAFLIVRDQTADLRVGQQDIRAAYTSDLKLDEKDLYNNTNLTGNEVASFIRHKWDEGYDIKLALREWNTENQCYEIIYAVGNNNSRLSYENYQPDLKYVDQNKGDFLLSDTIVNTSNNLNLEERLKQKDSTFSAEYNRYISNGSMRYEVSFVENEKSNKMSLVTEPIDTTEIKEFLVNSLDFIEEYDDTAKNFIDDKYSKYAYKNDSLKTLNDWYSDTNNDNKDDDFHLQYTPATELEPASQEVLSGDKDLVSFTGRLNHSAAILRALINEYTHYNPNDENLNAELEETIKSLTGGVILSSGDNIEGSDEGMFALTSYEGNKEFLAIGNIFEDANSATRTHTGSRLAFWSENLYTASKIKYNICTVQTGAFNTTQGKKVKTIYLTGNTKILNNAFGEVTENGDIIKKSGLENIIISQSAANNVVDTKITLYPKSLAGCSDVMVYFKSALFNESHNQFRYKYYNEDVGTKSKTAAYYFAENLVEWFKVKGLSDTSAIDITSAILNELRTTKLDDSSENLQTVLDSLDAKEKSLVKLKITDKAIQIQDAFGAKSIHIIRHSSYVQKLDTVNKINLTSADIATSVKFSDGSHTIGTGSVMPFYVKNIAYPNTKFLLDGKAIDAFFRGLEVEKGSGTQTYKLTLPKAYNKIHICYRAKDGKDNVKTISLIPVNGEEKTYSFSINWNSINDILNTGEFKDKMRFMIGLE